MRARQGERGLSLAEMLVALTILALAGTVALFLYDAARRSFKKGENAAEQQQSVRIAYDRLVADLRSAGLNVHPDGAAERRDEPVEAAYDTAVVVRADFDGADPASADDPEAALAGGAFAAVAVGNDEIVAYVLANDASADTLVFEADVKDVPRDGVAEVVRVPGVALVHDDPPYTLYRVTLNNDASTWGGGGFLVRTPLLDNVRSLTFRYFDAFGPVNAAFDLSSPSDDIGGAEDPASRRRREGIRRIEVQVEGLTRDPDLAWEDPDDPDPATRRLRKFRLSGDVTPRNIGRRGLQDLGWDDTPPAPPGAPTLVAGHCQGLLVRWPANPAGDGVAAYRVNLRNVSGGPVAARSLAATEVYLDALVNGAEYAVNVQAVDAAGNWSAPSLERQARLVNVNAPQPPFNVRASTDLEHAIRIQWDPVTENLTSEPAGDPLAPRIRDLEGYRIVRGGREDFEITDVDAVVVARERDTGAGLSWVDRAVAPCQTYRYRVIAWDYCDANNDTGAEAIGRAANTGPPSRPQRLEAVRSAGIVRLTWDPVATDRDEREIFIATYDVRRCDDGECDYLGAAGPAPFFEDTGSAGDAATYQVRARNACAADNASDWSDAASPGCSFPGTVQWSSPTTTWIAGPTTVRVAVLGGALAYQGIGLEFRRVGEATAQVVTLPGPGPAWTYDWTPPAPGGYTLRAVVTSDTGCTAAAATRLFVGPPS